MGRSVALGLTVGRLAALGHRFDVSTADRRLATYLRHALGPLSASGEADLCDYDLVPAGDGYDIFVDGELRSSPTPARVVPDLLSMINRAAVESTPHLLLLHAGGVARGSRVVVLPAPMESGKTTLTGALVDRGLDYTSPSTGTSASTPTRSRCRSTLGHGRR